MKSTLLLLLILSFGSLTHASGLKEFFSAKAGNWDLISGWTKGLHDDGTPAVESKETFHRTQVASSMSETSIVFGIFEDFCAAIGDENSKCRESLTRFQVVGEQLFLLKPPPDNSPIPVQVNLVTPTELDIRFTKGALTIMISEQISNVGLQTTLKRVKRVHRNGHLVEVSFLSSKKVR